MASKKAPPSPAPTPPPSRTDALKPQHCCLIIAVCVLVTFGRLFTADFTLWDDNATVSFNPDLNPPSRQKVMSYWGRIGADAPMSIYIPVTYTVWGLIANVAYLPDADPSGVHLNPWIFHGANVLVHVLSGLTAFAVLRLLVRDDRAALLGALVYALHPIMVESVGWISGMKDVLSGLFVLMAVLCYVMSVRERQHALFCSLSIGCALLAMFSKPAAVATPLLIVCIDRIMLGRPWRTIALAAAPFFVLAVPFALIAKASQPTYGAVYSPVWARPFVALDALAFYIGKILWPAKLGIDYGRSPGNLLASGWWKVTFVVPIVLAIVVWIVRRRLPIVVAGSIWFVICLLPVLGLVPYRMQFYSTVTDHYLYTAFFGVAMVVAWLLRDRGRIVTIGVSVILAVLAIRSIMATGDWKNNRSLNENALRVNPRSAVAMSNLGIDYAQAQDYATAESLLKQAVEINSETPQASEALVDISIRLGKINQAVDYAKRSLLIRDRAAPELQMKSVASKVGMGVVLERMNRFDEAREFYESALRDRPNDPDIMQRLRSLDGRMTTRPTTEPTTRQ